MHTYQQAQPTAGFHVKIGAAGRLVMPAEIRQLHNMRPGDTLIVRSKGGSVEIRTREQALTDIQDYICSLVPAGRSLVDELIEERRREAEKD